MRYLGIDLFKFLAIFYIVSYWHMFNYVNVFDDYNNIFTDIFTRILLGYFVFVSAFFAGKALAKKSIKGYIKDKIVRIYPLYLLAILTFFMLGISSNFSLFTAVFSLSMFIKPAPWTLWFITMIMMFFLISPLFLRFLNLSTYKMFGLLTSLFVVYYIYDIFIGRLDYRLYMYTLPFVFGFLESSNDKNSISKIMSKAQLVIAFCIGIYIAFHFYQSHSELVRHISKVPLVLFGASLAFLFSCKVKISTEYRGIITKLSYASFCMYLFHRPVFVLMNRGFNTLNNLYNKYLYLSLPIDLEWIRFMYLLLLAVPLTIFLSYHIQALYDSFLIRLKK